VPATDCDIDKRRVVRRLVEGLSDTIGQLGESLAAEYAVPHLPVSLAIDAVLCVLMDLVDVTVSHDEDRVAIYEALIEAIQRNMSQQAHLVETVQ